MDKRSLIIAAAAAALFTSGVNAATSPYTHSGTTVKSGSNTTMMKSGKNTTVMNSEKKSCKGTKNCKAKE